MLSVITIILFSTAVIASENNPEITSAPLNPEFIEYQSGLQDCETKNTIMATSADRNEYPLGLIPSPENIAEESTTETISENTTDTAKTNSIPALGVIPILGIFCILYVMRKRP